MNVKRVITGLAAFTMVATSAVGLSGCGGKTIGKSYTDDQGNKIYTYSFNMYTQDGTKYPETKDNEFDNMLYNDFGIEFEYERIPRVNWETKTNMYFQTGEEPDITTGGKEPNYKSWAKEGLLVPIAESLEELKEKMPNYVKLFDDIESVYDLASSADGKLYYLPTLRQEKTQMCWVYRKDVFDQLGIKEFPKTTEEFVEVCKKIKAAYPDQIIISSNGQKTSSLTGFFQAFGIPELAMSDHSYVDRDGTFVPFALATDQAREMYKMVSELYALNIIDKEILSIEKDQFYARCASDNAFITYNYVYNTDTFDKKTNANGKTGAEWAWTSNMLTNDKSRGTLFKKDPSYSNWGPAFSYGSDSEEGKLDKILSLYDWFATSDGLLYTSYGVDGVSYDLVPIDEYKAGELALVDADTELSDAEKTAKKADIEAFEVPAEWIKEKDGVDCVPVTKEGWYDQVYYPDAEKKLGADLGIMSSVFAKHPKSFYESRGSVIEPLYNEFMEKMDTENYYHIDAVPMRYTTEEEDRTSTILADLTTKRDEYMAKFLSGELDPSNDAHWNQYISDLNKLGLEEFSEIQTTVYERTQAELNK